MYPRSFNASPAFSSARPSTAARRPAANSAAFSLQFLSALHMQRAPLAEFSTFTGRSLNQNCIPNSFNRSRSLSEISRIQNGSNLSRPSTSVTLTPSANENRSVLAPDHSAADHPQAISEFAPSAKTYRNQSMHIIERNFRGTMRLRSVAIRMISPRNRRVLAPFVTAIVCASSNAAVPQHLNLVQLKIFQDAPPLHLHHFPLVCMKFMNCQIFFQRIIDSVKPRCPSPEK